jgi:hypothetical protein
MCIKLLKEVRLGQDAEEEGEEGEGDGKAAGRY